MTGYCPQTPDLGASATVGNVGRAELSPMSWDRPVNQSRDRTTDGDSVGENFLYSVKAPGWRGRGTARLARRQSRAAGPQLGRSGYVLNREPGLLG